MIDTPLFTSGCHSAVKMAHLALEAGQEINTALATVVKHGGNGVAQIQWSTNM
jgi:hypothetical protein